MNKLNKRIIVLIIIALIIVLCLGDFVYLIFFAEPYPNRRAKDAVSKAVYEQVGGEDVSFRSIEKEEDVLVYNYVLKREDKQVLYDFVTAINQMISEKNDKVNVNLKTPIPGGGREIIIKFYNFLETDQGVRYYDGLKRVYVNYPIRCDEVLLDPSTYAVIPDVHYFVLDADFKSRVEQLEIDWYKIWPNLEKYCICPHADERYAEEDK